MTADTESELTTKGGVKAPSKPRQETAMIKVYAATIMVEEREVLLTRKLAQQLYVRPNQYRWDLMLSGTPRPETLFKVNANLILDTHYVDSWMLLAADPVAGVSWQYPLALDEGWRKSGQEQMGDKFWEDILGEIPTVVLP